MSGRAYSIWARRLFNARQRCASHLLAIDTLDRLADHAGQIVGYSRRSLGPELGVKRRQAFNILDELARQGLIVAEARFSERGQQLANCYRWLAPWIRAQMEGEARAAMLAPRMHPLIFADGSCIHGDVACEVCRASSRPPPS